MITMDANAKGSSKASQFTRRPYRPENMNSLLEFARDNGLPPHQTQAGFKRFLTNLVSTPEKIIEIFQGEKRVAAGIILDRVINKAATTPFELLGLDHRVAEEAYTALLNEAEKEAPKHSTGMTLFHHFMHPFPDDLLLKRGYQPYLNTYSMIIRFPESRGIPLPAGVRLETLRMDNFDFYFELVKDTYSKNADFVVPDKQEFMRATMARAVPPLLIFDGTKLAGFVTIRRDERDSTLGRIDSLGVLTAHRRKGLGGVLLRQAIDALLVEKVARVALEVSDYMPDSLKLYEGLGFQVIDRFAGFIKENPA